MDEQRQLILDQFTRQAAPFSEMHARDGAGIHRLLIETADFRLPGRDLLRGEALSTLEPRRPTG